MKTKCSVNINMTEVRQNTFSQDLNDNVKPLLLHQLQIIEFEMVMPGFNIIICFNMIMWNILHRVKSNFLGERKLAKLICL